MCKNTYHMNCVRPPLLKKPSRGFAWSCAACARAQERKLEARNTPTLREAADEDEEIIDDEEDDGLHGGANDSGTGAATPMEGTIDDSARPETQEQMYQASLWPFRYLGIHCKPEDALDYDDRIYPRAGSRLGTRHQAPVMAWPGRPVVYVKKREFAKKGGRKEKGQSKEVQAAIEADRKERAARPKWVQDEPPGYVARGEDYDNDDPNCTATLLWKPPEEGEATITDAEIDEYMERARSMAPSMGLPENSTNLHDVAADLLRRNNYNATLALRLLKTVEKAKFKEPDLNAAELKKFEEAVAKFGSEWHLIYKYVRTVPYGDIVRWYYKWKKTKQGKLIWGNFSGRKGKKDARKAEEEASRLADEVADDHDDSAFDTDKASERKRAFVCKFCGTKRSRQWRRAPGSSAVPDSNKLVKQDKSVHYINALCRRCAEPWRRYGIQWEDINEIQKKLAQSGGRGSKRKVDDELQKEFATATEMVRITDLIAEAAANSQASSSAEPPKKKLKMLPEKEGEQANGGEAAAAAATTTTTAAKKKAAVEKAAAPPPEPEFLKPRTLPCAICRRIEPRTDARGDQHLSCKECRLAVHRNCYGVVDNRPNGKWVCDMCANDKNPQLSIVSVNGWTISGEVAIRSSSLTMESRITSVFCVRTRTRNMTSSSRQKSLIRSGLIRTANGNGRSGSLPSSRPSTGVRSR